MIIWNDDDCELSTHLIGGKALGLHALRKNHFQVPLWATITTEFFQSVITRHVRLQTLLRQGNAQDIREAIAEISLEKDEERLLEEVWKRVSENGEVSVAVRSSAADEDGSKFSFAGQMDSFLHVRSFATFVKMVLRCWASVFSERAVAYRLQNGLDPRKDSGKAKTAVIVQQMVDAEISGVVFTANPLNSRLDEMLITSAYGLGEGLVSGQLDADTYVLDRSGRTLRAEYAEKKQKVVSGSQGGTQLVEIQDDLKSSLSQDQLRDLHLLALRAEEAQGIPLDIEFSISQNTIFFLQARPITSLKKRDHFKVWDNSNIAESYSGVTTPLTFSFIRQAYFAVYCQFCETIGISQKVIFKNRHILENMLGLIQGRVYYNLLNWYELVSLMPGFEYNKGFMEQMMGLQVIGESKPKSSPQAITSKYCIQLPRLFKVASKMLLAHVRLPKQIAKFHAHFHRIYSTYANINYAQMTPAEMLAVYRVLEEEVLWKWRSPITNDFEAMIFYGLLKKLTLKWGLDPEGVLQNDLLSGEGDITSTALIAELSSFAADVGCDETLKAHFIQGSPEEAFTRLKASPVLYEKFTKYLETYGVRCINEMKLESIPIKDDPLFCIAAIQNYLRNGIPDPKQQMEREKQLRENAEGVLRQRLRPVRRHLYQWVLGNARRAIKNRENQRFARTQAYSLVRTLIQEIGKQWQAGNIVDQARDIFYLEIEEIWSYIEGTSTCVNLKGLIELRKQEFKAYAAEDPDDRIETTGEVYFGNPFSQHVLKDQEGLIKGLGCCSGVVEGKVKVVLAPDSQLQLNKEIMVAKQTDPGWGVLFPSVSGLIIEKGSMLSHSAIVAREMGIPAVIGVKNATRIFSTGDTVRLDGGKGTVEIL